MGDGEAPRVLVTGAAKRIGRAIALAFAQAGYEVIVHYHTSRQEAEDLCDILRAENGLNHVCKGCELRAEGAIDGLLDSLQKEGRGLAVLVNNASVYRRCDLSDLSADRLAEDADINFRVPWQLMQAYHRRFQSGQIINLLDYRVCQPDPASGGYGLAKKALMEATLAAAAEWAPAFRVNGLAPGLVLAPPGVPAQNMNRLLERIPSRRRTTEEEIGRCAVFIAQMECLNGQILYADGGLHLLGAEATGERHGGTARS